MVDAPWVNAVYTVYTMSKPIAAARIPHSWDEQIREIATETGRTPSEVVKEAIGLYLEKTDTASVTSMNHRLNKLERQYQKLAQLI
ncbi:MAG: hypothetical protein AAFW84_33170 [Cyanobacteria bacterium J06635_15]